MWISAAELRRQYKAERKLEREVLREVQRGQAKRNQELSQKAKIAVSRKITALESKIRSQTEAAAMLDCAISNWQREKQGRIKHSLS